MTLEQYLARPDSMTATALAKAINVTPARISQLKKKGDWSPELAIAAERATGGVLDAGSLNRLIAEARKPVPSADPHYTETAEAPS
jgi:hypothetical protein